MAFAACIPRLTKEVFVWPQGHMKTMFNFYIKSMQFVDINREMLSQAIKDLDTLKHKLSSAKDEEDARKIQEEAKNMSIGVVCAESQVDDLLFRCSSCFDVPEQITCTNRYSYPPEEKVSNPQRMNIKNDPVFYGASDIKTALHETGIKENQAFYVSAWEIIDDEKMLTFPCITSVIRSKALQAKGDYAPLAQFAGLIKSSPEFDTWYDMLTEIMSIPQNDKDALHKYIYYLTGGLAYNIRHRKIPYKDSLREIDAILYPSVVLDGGKYNLAIRPQFVREHMRIKYVIKGIYNQGKVTCSFKYIGFNEKDKIKWKQLFKQVVRTKIVKYQDQNRLYEIEGNESFLFEGQLCSISEMEKTLISKLNRQDSSLKEIPFLHDSDISLCNPKWIDEWMKDHVEDLIIADDLMRDVQVSATLHSFFSEDGVKLTDVFNEKMN